MSSNNVAYHNKINFFENLFVYFLIEVSKEEKLRAKIRNKNLKKFIVAVDRYRDSKDISPKDFVCENYQEYKTLVDYDMWALLRDFERDGGDASKMAQKIVERKPHKTFEFSASCEGAVSSILEKWLNDKDISEWRAFIIRGNTKSYESNDDPILIMDDKDNNTVYRIQRYSELLRFIGDKSEKKLYLALDEEILSTKLGDSLSKVLRKYIPSLEGRYP